MTSETDGMVAAAEAAGLDAPVESCPGWDVTALLRHVGTVHRWVARVIATGDMGTPRPEGTAPRGPDLFEWVGAGAAELVAVGSDKGPSAPASNWAGATPTTGFWFRRMANETAVHSWDARAATGAAEPIAADLATDAIDEWLTVMGPLRPPEGLSGTVHIHCTDVPGDWTVELGTFTTERGRASADTELRGPASTVLLRLLSRSDEGEIRGDPSVLAHWREKVRF